MTGDNPQIGRIALLSTHGYFDPVPQLGKTDTGGQVLYVLELAKALASHGVPVDIFTRWFDRSARRVDPVTADGSVRVIRIPAGPWDFLAKEHIYEVLPELSENMVAFIRDSGLEYDLFHGHYVDAGIVALDVARALERPAFFTAHSLGAWKREQMPGDPEEMEEKYRFEHRIAEELRIFRSVAAQTLTTNVQREKLEQLYGFGADNIAVIPPGVNTRVFRPAAAAEPRSEDIPDEYVFCLSRIDANKGHDLLLEAFDIVRDRVSDVHLLIGGGSPEPQERELAVYATMEDIIAERGLEDRTRILGYVPDDLLVSLYQHARLFVLPSIFEPFGMTALEAMACARPVVASRLGGIRTVIRHDENGLLVDPSDASEFADAITRLLQDRAAADRIGGEGLRTVLEAYSWEMIGARHLEFYGAFLT